MLDNPTQPCKNLHLKQRQARPHTHTRTQIPQKPDSLRGQVEHFPVLSISTTILSVPPFTRTNRLTRRAVAGGGACPGATKRARPAPKL